MDGINGSGTGYGYGTGDGYGTGYGSGDGYGDGDDKKERMISNATDA